MNGVIRMKKFVSGVLVGTLATVAAAGAFVATVKKQVIDPIDEKEAMIEENRKKAMRKRVAR